MCQPNRCTLSRRWFSPATLLSLLVLTRPAARITHAERAGTRTSEDAAPKEESAKPEQDSNRPEGVRQTRQEEQTTVVRTTEERVVPRWELTGDEEEETGELRPFGAELFDETADMAVPLPDVVPPADYALAPGDELELRFWSAFIPQEMHEIAVDPQGQIALPEGGTLSVRGLTLEQVRELAQQQLLRLYNGVKVHVALTKMRSIRVWVGGETKRIGTQLLSPMSTAFNALQAAGGPNEIGSMRRIRLMRGNQELAVIDLYQYLLTGDAEGDVRLQSGDRLFVPVAGPQVAVEGEVRRPALFELVGGERLQDLLEWAGGPKPTGYAKRIQITRIEDGARRTVRDIDASKLLQAPDEETNVPAQGGDAIRVFPVLDERQNAVRLEGEVNRSGAFEWTEGMRVKDLLEQAEGVLEDDTAKRGEVTRIEPGGGTRLIAFDVAAALAGEEAANVVLAPRDRVVIYAGTGGGMPINVHISGPVKRPGRYRYVAGMTVQDLLRLSGDVIDEAEIVHCTLERVFAPASETAVPGAVRERLSKDGASAEARVRSGDEQWVFVDGRVSEPSRVEFDPRQPLKYYLEKAGGVTADADLDGIRVYRANGDVVRGNAIVSLESGDRVFVPPKEASDTDLSITARYLLDHVPSGQRTLSVMIDLEKVREDDPEWDVPLKPGDQLILYTPESLRWRGGYVKVLGEVVRPREYERAEGMTVADLLFKAGGLLPEAHPTRALIERTLPGGEKQMLTVDPTAALAGDGASNLALQNRDKLVVFHHSQVELDRRKVEIQGAVQHPGEYPLTRGMQLADLIMTAGGLLPEAHTVAEIVRLTEDGERVPLTANLERLMRDGDESQNVVLQNFDSVSVPSVTDERRLAESVTVVGEVRNPGVYLLDDPNTTLSEVLNRSGGLTEDAYLPGASIRRRMDRVVSDAQRLAMQAVLAESYRIETKEYLATAGARETTQRPERQRFELGSRPGDLTDLDTEEGDGERPLLERKTESTQVDVDFSAALAAPKSAADVVLQDGDVITIPKRPIAVLVAGAVVKETVILHDGPRPLNYYLDRAGGLSKDARGDQIEIIRANGSIVPASRVRIIEPGDIIVVPSRAVVYRQKKTWMETLQSISPFLSLALVTLRN